MIKQRIQFLIIIALILLTGFLATSLASFYISRSAVRERIGTTELPLTTDNIYTEIQRDLLQPIFISSLMAHDTFLIDWIISGERGHASIKKYLHTIMEKYGTFTSFLVSDITDMYYHPTGVLKKISPHEPRDIWYYRVRNLASDYEINVDVDMANQDTLTIFVNHRITDYDDNFIGATGVGLNIHRVNTLIKKYESKYQRNIFFIDNKGSIVLTGANYKGKKNIWEIPGLAPFAENILSKNESTQAFTRNGSYIQFTSRYISELDWHVVVEQLEERATASLYTALAGNILVSLMVTIVVLILLNLVIKKYQLSITRKKTALDSARNEIMVLSGFLPICSSCKKIRDDKGYWNQLEDFITRHSSAEFSHSICPDCTKKLYPDLKLED